MAVYFDILEAVEKLVVDHDLLAGVGDIREIPVDNIDIWTAPLLNVGKEKWENAPTPGLIISPARTVRVPPSGPTDLDDVHYPVLLQLTSREFSKNNRKRIRAYLEWSERLRKFFHQQDLRLEVFNSDGHVDLCYIGNQDIVDERLFGFHHFMVSYIPLTVISREPRDSNGSI